MKIKYNTQKLEMITKDLFILTGMTITILDNKANFICKCSKSGDFCAEIHNTSGITKKCTSCDKYLIEKCTKSGKFESHICHAGLFDGIVPIKKNDTLICYVMMGRVRCADSPGHFGGTEEEQALYHQTPFFSDEQIKSMSSLLSNILFDEAVCIEIDNTAEEIAQYIKENYMDDINVSSLCEKFFISKNSLYKLFGNYYGVTVNEYITTVRLEEAKKLLSNTTEPIYSVCEKTGFGDCTYFCRLFKKRFQKTPVQFRSESGFKAVK